MSSQKKILVIATGGTIESFYGADGDSGENAPYNVPQDKNSIIPDALKALDPNHKCDFYEACQRDSKGVNSDILHHIALYISQHASEYDGIVITHGTDTMPRNARALEDMLETIGVPPVPIVFTGSMIPLRDENKNWRKDSDGRENLKNALEDVRRHDAGVHIRMGEFFVSADKVDKSVELNDDIKKPNNTVRHGEFVDYDPKRWQPLTPYS